ncbi:MAG TPA: CpsB/CapC family capsule biosynthesis tyrosine phosphatase, partial [Solirubrobacteraceae bacterium]
MPAVDLHCHLLPAVDDGPATLDESVEYARAAVAAGTGTIVATPHVEMVDVRSLPERVDEVRAALAEEGIDLRVEVGGELKPQSIGALRQDELEIIAHGPPGARWLLYEVPFRGVDDAFVAGAK